MISGENFYLEIDIKFSPVVGEPSEFGIDGRPYNIELVKEACNSVVALFTERKMISHKLESLRVSLMGPDMIDYVGLGSARIATRVLLEKS